MPIEKDSRLEALCERWDDLLIEAGPTHAKTMAEALMLIRTMEREDEHRTQDDPFEKLTDDVR